MFKLFDDDNTGKITLRNLKRVSQELGENIDDDELMDMLMQVTTCHPIHQLVVSMF